MDFIAAVPVAVGGEGVVKVFKNDIQRADGGAVHGKADVHIRVEGFGVFVAHFLNPFYLKNFLPDVHFAKVSFSLL